MPSLHFCLFTSVLLAVVGQDHAEPSTSLEAEAESFPQWGIAVLVIGLAAIAFVVIFGVSMVRRLNFYCNSDCIINRWVESLKMRIY